MQWKAKITAATFSAAILVGMTIPAASASAASLRESSSLVTSGIDSTPNTLCNTQAGGSAYGCILSRGYAKAVVLDQPPSGTDFYAVLVAVGEHYYQIQQNGTDLCLNWNPDSGSYPVNMNTCGDSADQWWYLNTGTSGRQIKNYGSGTCLEGSETDGYGDPLTMSPCGDNYSGENWGSF
jgi:Ricin-type beta-trefoil lectin domain